MDPRVADKENLALEIRQVIAKQLGVELDAVKPDAAFIEDLGADSLDIVELVMAMEETFSIEIPDESAEKIQTVQDAINYIKTYGGV